MFITSQPVDTLVPVVYRDGVMVAAWDHQDLAEAGLIKIDLLASHVLDHIAAAADPNHGGPGISQVFNTDATTNPPTTHTHSGSGSGAGVVAAGERAQAQTVWTMLAAGHTAGVFQLSGPLGQQAAQTVQPASLDELAAVIALIRPGTTTPGARITDTITDFADRGRSLDWVTSLARPDQHELITDWLTPILGPTRGMLLYQEQAMQIAGSIAGFDPAERASLQQACKTGDRAELSRLGDQFLARAPQPVTNGDDTLVSPPVGNKTATRLWQMITDSAAYLFCRAHAIGYTVTCWATAWLKATQPAGWAAAVLSDGKSDQNPALVSQVADLGATVIPPSLVKSPAVTEADHNNTLWLGLNIKGVGARAADLITARTSTSRLGPITGAADLNHRLRSCQLAALPAIATNALTAADTFQPEATPHPEPESGCKSAPGQDPESEPEPAPEPVSEPVSESKPEPGQELGPVSDAKPTVQPDPTRQPTPDGQNQPTTPPPPSSPPPLPAPPLPAPPPSEVAVSAAETVPPRPDPADDVGDAIYGADASDEGNPDGGKYVGHTSDEQTAEQTTPAPPQKSPEPQSQEPEPQPEPAPASMPTPEPPAPPEPQKPEPAPDPESQPALEPQPQPGAASAPESPPAPEPEPQEQPEPQDPQEPPQQPEPAPQESKPAPAAPEPQPAPTLQSEPQQPKPAPQPQRQAEPEPQRPASQESAAGVGRAAPDQNVLRAITIIVDASSGMSDVQPMLGTRPDPDISGADAVKATRWMPYRNPMAIGEPGKLYRVEGRNAQRGRPDPKSRGFSRTVPILVCPHDAGDRPGPEQVMAAAAAADWVCTNQSRGFSVAHRNGHEATVAELAAADATRAA